MRAAGQVSEAVVLEVHLIRAPIGLALVPSIPILLLKIMMITMTKDLCLIVVDCNQGIAFLYVQFVMKSKSNKPTLLSSTL